MTTAEKKHIYRRHLLTVGPFRVWSVNGMYIRTKVNEEFTNFGQHFRFRMIPTYEFWIDEEHDPGETRFFVDHMLREWRLMSRGISYETAIVRADLLEQTERNRTALAKKIKKMAPKEIPSASFLSRLRVQPIKKYSWRGCTTWIVDGEMIRDRYFIDFTEGGHEYVYHFVPHGDIWIDDDISMREWKYVVLHELHERALMAGGMEYHRAHASASHIEHVARHRSSHIAPWIREEIVKNIAADQKISK